MGQVRCSDFQLAVCRLDLVVDSWDVDIITSNMRVGSQEFDDVQRKFRVFENARTGRTAPYLGEIRNWLKLFYFIFSPGFSLFLCRLNQLVSILCQPEIFDELVFVLVEVFTTASVVNQVVDAWKLL